MLNTKQIEGLKAKDRQYKVSDAESLYLVVTPHAVKSWRTEYKDKPTGKRKTHTFGRYPEIGLAKARLLNSEFKDPIAHGSISKSPLFDEKLDAKKLLGLADEQGEVLGMEGEGLPQLNANQPQLQIPQQIVQQQGVQNGY